MVTLPGAVRQASIIRIPCLNGLIRFDSQGVSGIRDTVI